MQITCGNCGKDIIVPDGLAAGQHVRCPYCNEKSALDKPSRIELPEGFETKRRSRAKIDALKQAAAAATPQTPADKPRIAIRRPAQTPTRDRDHMNAAAAAVDARVRKAERRRRIARFKKAFGDFAAILALVALLVAGYVVWKAVRTKKMPVEMPEQTSQLISNVVEKVRAEMAK